MIIEITGSSGAGKTFISKELIKHITNNWSNFQLGAIHEKCNIHDNVAPGILANPELHNWKTDLVVIPWVFFFALRNLTLVFHILKEILFLPNTFSYKTMILRSVLRKMGIFQYFSRARYKSNLIFVDEGLLHILSNIFVHPMRKLNIMTIKKLLKLMPLSDFIVIITAKPKNLVENLSTRGNWSPKIKSSEQLYDFSLKNSKLFMELKKNKRISARALVVDNKNSNLEEIKTKFLEHLLTIINESNEMNLQASMQYKNGIKTK